MTTKTDACKCRCGVRGGSGEREARERVRDECLYFTIEREGGNRQSGTGE